MLRVYTILLFIFISAYSLWAEPFIMPVPLYVDSSYLGEIDLQIDNDIIKLRPYPLIIKLKDKLDWTKAEISLTRWSEDQWVTPDSLSSAVIHPVFDEKNLILTVIIPAESRKPQILSLAGGSKPLPEHVIYSTEFSGILNMDSWTRYNYESMYLDYRISPELALQYKGFVMEAKGGLKSGTDLFFYDYLRIVRDFPSLMYRAEAGDLTFNAGGFLKEKIVGFSFYRKTSLNQNYQSRPPLGRRIFFPESADVEILINNRIASRHHVPQGTWTFESFPLVQGANDIVIKWTDSLGDHEDRFFHIYDGKLLKMGETDLGGSLGTDSYLTFNPSLLFHFSNGVTPNLTMGADFYYDINQYYFALGAPLLMATPIGIFSLVPRLDLPMTEGVKGELNLNHTYSVKREEKADLNFGSSLGILLASYPVASGIFSLSGYYNFYPVKGLSITPTLRWSWDLTENTYYLDTRLRVRKNSGDGSIITAELGIKHNEDGWMPLASITFSASFHEIQQNFYARGDLSGKKMTLAWNRYAASEGSSDYNMGVSGVIPAENTERLTLSVNGGYTHPLFTASATQGYNTFLSTGETNNSTTLTLGSAMVYADGILGFSRPIRGGFVLVQSEMGPLEVNPTLNSSLLSLDGEAPGVIPSPAPYRYTNYRLVPENLPIGSDINDYSVNVYPTYRSGILLTAQAKIYMYAGGVLLDRKGNVLSLRLGYLESVLEGEDQKENSGETQEKREFFTDDSGYFECYGLIPGDYTLSLKDEDLVYNITIAARESGFFSLGKVSPED